MATLTINAAPTSGNIVDPGGTEDHYLIVDVEGDYVIAVLPGTIGNIIMYAAGQGTLLWMIRVHLEPGGYIINCQGSGSPDYGTYSIQVIDCPTGTVMIPDAAATSDSIDALGEYKYYQFTVSAAGRYGLYFTPDTYDGVNRQVYFYGPDDLMLDESYFGYYIIPGVYYFTLAANYSAPAIGAYSLQVVSFTADTPLTIDAAAISDSLDAIGDMNFYQFVVTEAASYKIETIDGTIGSLSMSLYGPDDSSIYIQDRYGSATGEIIINLPIGTYYIQIEQVNDSDIGIYDIAVSYDGPLTGGVISGTVTDLQGDPIEGVDIYLYMGTWEYANLMATTNSSGYYTILSVPAETYKLEFWPSLHVPKWWDNKVDNDDLAGYNNATAIVVVDGSNITGIDAYLLLPGEEEPIDPNAPKCFYGYPKSCGLCTPPILPMPEYGCRCETCKFNCWGTLGENYVPTVVEEYEPPGYEDLSSEPGVTMGKSFYQNAITYVPSVLPVAAIVQSAKNELKKVMVEGAANLNINGSGDSEADTNAMMLNYGLDITKATDQVKAQKLQQFEAGNVAEKGQSVYIAEILKGIDKAFACIWGQISTESIVGLAAEWLEPGDLVHVYTSVDPVTLENCVCVEAADCRDSDDITDDVIEAEYEDITPTHSNFEAKYSVNRRADGFVKTETHPGQRVRIWKDCTNIYASTVVWGTRYYLGEAGSWQGASPVSGNGGFSQEVGMGVKTGGGIGNLSSSGLSFHSYPIIQLVHYWMK
jgi:hypothetical protein